MCVQAPAQHTGTMKQADIYRSTAVALWVGGFVLAGWGTLFFRPYLDGDPYVKPALVRIFGAIVMADGCFAAALANADPRAMRRGTRWFAIAHGLVVLMLILQRLGPLTEGLADLAINVMLSAAVLFGYFWFTANGPDKLRIRILQTLFRRDSDASEPTPEAEYAEGIRKAAAQEERNRLARDLHDSIKQQLFAVQTAAATAQARYDSDAEGALTAIEQVRASARDALTEMDAMLDQLRASPLENVGLEQALRQQCEALGHRSGANVTVKVGTLPDSKDLPPGAQEALYRGAQEALSNVARHARASNVAVRLDTFRHALQLSVQDDGSGFDPAKADGGLGLRNMRTRMDEVGGEFEILAQPGRGSTVTLRVPLRETIPARSRLQWAICWLVLFLNWCRWFWQEPEIHSGTVLVIAAAGVWRETRAWHRARKGRV